MNSTKNLRVGDKVRIKGTLIDGRITMIFDSESCYVRFKFNDRMEEQKFNVEQLGMPIKKEVSSMVKFVDRNFKLIEHKSVNYFMYDRQHVKAGLLIFGLTLLTLLFVIL